MPKLTTKMPTRYLGKTILIVRILYLNVYGQDWAEQV